MKKVVTFLFNRTDDRKTHAGKEERRYRPQRIKGGDIAQIRRVADKLSPRTAFDERTGWGTVRIDSQQVARITALPDQPGTMPNVVGMGLKDALFLLESRGAKVAFTGRGTVRQQSIAPGAKIAPGTTVTITLR